jgi:hypothetical protein
MPESNPFAIPSSPPEPTLPAEPESSVSESSTLAEAETSAPASSAPAEAQTPEVDKHAESTEQDGAAEPATDTTDRAKSTAESDEPVAAVPTVPAVADDILLAAVDVARAALIEITPEETIGAPVGHIVEGDRVLSLLFECTMRGYPGWHWTVTLARTDDDAEPSVLETELMPGENALLAPDWVPWSDRLADYQASQEAARLAESGTEDDATDDADDEIDDDDVEDDEDDDDDADIDDVELDDIDGVDIDELHSEVNDADGQDDAEDDFEADDITGVELAALDLQEDQTAEAQDDSDGGRPDQPDAVGGGERPEEQQ